MGGQDRVIRFNNGRAHFGGRVDREFQFGFFTVIGRQSFEQERSETGTGSTTKGVENKESLKTGTVIGESSDSFEDIVDELFTDSVVTSGVWKERRETQESQRSVR